jgi:glycosidase
VFIGLSAMPALEDGFIAARRLTQVNEMGQSARRRDEYTRRRSMAAPRYPSLYQINTRVWLARMSRAAGRRLGLAEIDDATIDGWAEQGFDWIWLLSVWQTGALGRAIARADPDLRRECLSVLPDLSEDDICGSGFAITAYRVAEGLGGEAGLAAFRERLARRGIRLMLDFVANHTALDHPWVAASPDYYVAGNEAALAAAPRNYIRVETDRGPRILAHGRDPSYPGWTDTLQLDYANPGLQRAQIAELVAIAGRCDGVRCDMAMLLLPEVFERSWGRRPAPFWPQAIAVARARHPHFTLMAEVYWDLEWTLQQQGFDYCYDKRLYDRLRAGAVAPIRDHLRAGLEYQDRLARFLENHDEPRAAGEFPWPQQQAAAAVTFLAPGLRFFYDGQFEGARLRVPVQLCRGPVEPADSEIAAFYARLLRAIKDTGALRHGDWSLIEPEPAWPGNWTNGDFLACGWAGSDGARCVVVVNCSGHPGQCRLRLPFPELRGRRVRLVDLLGAEVYDRDGGELAGPGLFIDHAPWHSNLFALAPI